MNDPIARRLAAAALAVALVALVVAGYAVSLGQQYLEDVRLLGAAMERQSSEAPLNPPPLQLAD